MCFLKIIKSFKRISFNKDFSYIQKLLVNWGANFPLQVFLQNDISNKKNVRLYIYVCLFVCVCVCVCVKYHHLCLFNINTT